LSSAGCETGSHALSAAFYADGAEQQRVTITQNERLARATYCVRFDCSELAARIVPGQFLMLRLPHDNDPLLGRPFALYDTVVDAAGTPTGIDVVYLVVGKMTEQLANCRPGDELDVWGPLGNGFSAAPVEHLIMVAGGIGQTPFLALGREFLGGRRYGNDGRVVTPAQKVTMCYGVRSKDYLAGVEDFRACGIDLKISSDDGTAGHHGLVTELLDQVLNENSATSSRIACCGPERMMEAVAGIARFKNVSCEVSLETPMACGIGICFSCVVKTEQADGDWDYKRTCVEGPVFEARKLVW
jgi:dihydroorotate dehydrogenase electron transfer subunit